MKGSGVINIINNNDDIAENCFSNLISLMGCEDVLIVAETTPLRRGTEQGYTTNLTANQLNYMFKLSKKMEDNIEFSLELYNNTDPDNLNVDYLSYLGAVQSVDVDEKFLNDRLKSKGIIVIVGITGSQNTQLENGMSKDEKINYGNTYAHELVAHAVKHFYRGTSTGEQDHMNFFNYNESTKDWYAERGFSEKDLNEGYSPAVFHPSSKAYKLEQGIKTLINNIQNNQEGTSPINNSGPIPGQ